MYDGPHISNKTRVVTGLKCVNKHGQRLAPLYGPMCEDHRCSGEALDWLGQLDRHVRRRRKPCQTGPSNRRGGKIL
jgi:hypothetical protein